MDAGTHRSEFTYDGLDRRIRIVEKESTSVVRDAHLFWDGGAIIEERLSTGEAIVSSVTANNTMERPGMNRTGSIGGNFV